MLLLVQIVVSEALLLVNSRWKGAERDLVARRREDVSPVTAHRLIVSDAAKSAGNGFQVEHWYPNQTITRGIHTCRQE